MESESRELTRMGACGTTGGEVIEDTRTLYDGKGFGVAPTKGLPTEVQELDETGTGYVTIDRTEYDIHGRESATWDAENRKTSVVNTPATIAPAVKTISTDPLGFTRRRRPGSGARTRTATTTPPPATSPGRRSPVWAG